MANHLDDLSTFWTNLLSDIFQKQCLHLVTRTCFPWLWVPRPQASSYFKSTKSPCGTFVFTHWYRTTSLVENFTICHELSWMWIRNSSKSLTNTSQLGRKFLLRTLLNQPITKWEKIIPSHELTNFLLCQLFLTREFENNSDKRKMDCGKIESLTRGKIRIARVLHYLLKQIYIST